MTRLIHDQFAKDYLEILLKPYGEVQAPRQVSGEPRQIDIWFAPAPGTENPEPLGLLGRMANSPSLFEPFRNPATPEEICNCLLKLLEVRGELQREANRNKTTIQEAAIPNLWILTPTESAAILSGFRAIIDEDWLPGIYFMGEYLRTAIVVIHQLPRTPETLWLRLLGKGAVQKQAIDELDALPKDNPFRFQTLKVMKNLRKHLGLTQNLDEDDALRLGEAPTGVNYAISTTLRARFRTGNARRRATGRATRRATGRTTRRATGTTPHCRKLVAGSFWRIR